MKPIVSIFLTLTLSVMAIAGLDQAGIYDDVVAIYHFENADDSGPREFNGSLQENASIVDNGKVNKCLRLQNSDWFGLIDEQFLGITGEFSIVAWIKMPKQPKNFYMVMAGINDDDTIDGSASLDIKPSGNIEGVLADFERNTSAVLLSENQNVADNKWHHIAFTQYANTYHLFVDGENVKTDRQTGYVGFVGGNTFISISLDDGDNTNITGSVFLDEVGFFEIGFSIYEIKGIYNDGLPDFLEAMPVNPQEKAATTWGALKRRRF